MNCIIDGRSPRGPSIAKLLVVAAVGLSGCAAAAGSPAPGASPTQGADARTAPPAPSSSPSPAPSVGPTERLLATLQDPAGSALLSIQMTESVSSAIFIDGVAMSPAPPHLVLTYTGEVLVDGDDHFARLKADGENDWVVESMRQDGAVSRRFMADGWATGADVPRLPDLLRSIESLDPDGTVDLDGRTLDRFVGRTSVPIELATVWYTDKPGREPDAGTINVIATPDGTPVAATLAFTSDDMSIPSLGLPAPAPRTYQVDLAWIGVQDGIMLPDASEALAPTAVSEHDLTVGLPAGWKRETVDGIWVWYESPGPDAYVGVTRVEIPAAALDDPADAQLYGWSENVHSLAVDELGVEPGAVEAVRVGDSAGRMATFHPSDGPGTQLYASFVSGPWAYVVRWQSDTAFDLIARYRFERILESVDVSPG